ncbi:MAG: P1 family peptidase, partial [Dehalococcoidia bacterium]|nr:P1 family peptidase [Dehalococcoidia bacterium]
MFGAITDVLGIKVGHYTHKKAATGCTVILCEEGAVAGVDISGSSPGTRETDLLRPGNLVEKVQAVVLSGGSAFGLDAATGVMKYLEERGFGYETSAAKVPIVPAAIIFDLNIGDSKIRPGADEGYQACLAATNGKVTEGCVGAGTGATVGKILGMERAVKSGLGTASQRIARDVVVAARVVVNAV